MTTNKNLQVPAYALAVGIDYAITLSASAYGYAGSASINIAITSTRPVAVVKGGNRRISSAGTSDMILDASKSRNTIFSPFHPAAYFSTVFIWKCFYREDWSEVDMKVCPPDWFTKNKIQLVFRRRNLPVDLGPAVFSFILTVNAKETDCVLQSTIMGGQGALGSCDKDERIDSDETAVEIHTDPSSSIPLVTLEVTSGKKSDVEPAYSEAPARTIVTVSVSATLVISSSITSTTPVKSIRWSIRDSVPLECVDDEWCAPGKLLTQQCPTDGGKLESSASICRNDAQPVAIECSQGCGDTLILEANTFLGPGGSGVLGVRTFDLYVTDMNDKVGFAFVHVLVDHGPDFGDLTASPAFGLATLTKFDAAATQWTDRPPGDSVFSPMSYIWSIRENGCSTAFCEVLLTENSWVSSIKTILPLGTWKFGVYVTDAIGTEYLVLSASSITVDPPPLHSPVTSQLRSGHAVCSQDYLAQMRVELLQKSQDSKDEFIVVLHGGRTINWCHQQRAIFDTAATDTLQWEASSTNMRSLLVTLTKRFWEQGSAKSQSRWAALQAAEALRAAVLIPEQVSQEALGTAAPLLSNMVHSIIDIFRRRRASLPRYPTEPGILDSESSPDIPQANVLASKAVEALNSLTVANQLLSDNSRRAGIKAGYLEALKLMKVIQEVSALSVCNVFAGSTASFSSDYLNISTSFISYQNLAGWSLVSKSASSLSNNCNKARDLAACCSKSIGSCCVDDACTSDKWPDPHWVDGPAVLIMPDVIENRAAFDYEVQLAQLRGNSFDSTHLLSGSTVFMAVREADTETVLLPSKPGILEQERILRMPISKQTYDLAILASVNTAEKNGLIPACVVWDEELKDWVTAGIRQVFGLAPIHKMCISNSSATIDSTSPTPCFYALECFTSLSQGIFAVIDAEMDCEGVPLGNGKWDMCDMCNGDNSTCSGCDNMPNTVHDGVVMTKECSGHGKCVGLMCRCCAGEQDVTESSNATNGTAECEWFGETCHRYCTRDPHEKDFGIHCNSHGYCSESGRNCACDPGYTDAPDGICAMLIPLEPEPMDPALKAFIYYGSPVLGLGMMGAVIFFAMAYLRRRQAKKQQAQVEHAILKQLTMPTLEELDGEMPGGDPFAPGADKTEGLNVIEKQAFLEQLRLRKQKWKDPDFLSYDPDEILEESLIDSTVTGYLFAGKFESSAAKASVVAVNRRDLMKEKAHAMMSVNGASTPKLDKFHEERAEALLLAGNRLPMSRSHPFRILDSSVDLPDALQNRQLKAQVLSTQHAMGEEMPERVRRTYRHEAIKNAVKPRAIKRIKKAMKLGPQEEKDKDEMGETEIEVAV